MAAAQGRMEATLSEDSDDSSPGGPAKPGCDEELLKEICRLEEELAFQKSSCCCGVLLTRMSSAGNGSMRTTSLTVAEALAGGASRRSSRPVPEEHTDELMRENLDLHEQLKKAQLRVTELTERLMALDVPLDEIEAEEGGEEEDKKDLGHLHRLRRQVRSMTDEFEHKKYFLEESAKQSNQIISQQLATSKAQLAKAQDEVVNLHQQLVACHEAIKSKDQEIAVLQEDHDERFAVVQGQLAAASRQADEISDEAEALRRQFSRVGTPQGGIADAVFAELSDEEASQGQPLDEEDVGSQDGRVKHAEEEMVALRTECKELRGACAQLRTHIATIEAKQEEELRALRSQCSEQQAEARTTKARHEEELLSLRSRWKQQRHETETLKAKKDEDMQALHMQIQGAAELAKAGKEEELHSLRSQCGKLREQAMSIEARKETELQQLRNNIQQLQDQISGLEVHKEQAPKEQKFAGDGGARLKRPSPSPGPSPRGGAGVSSQPKTTGNKAGQEPRAPAAAVPPLQGKLVLPPAGGKAAAAPGCPGTPRRRLADEVKAERVPQLLSRIIELQSELAGANAKISEMEEAGNKWWWQQ